MQKSSSVTAAPQTVNLTLCFGDDSEQKKILQLDALFQMGIQDTELSKHMIKQNNAQQNDMFIMIKFHVVKGRQKQAMDYLQKGMDQMGDKEMELLNPIQKLLIRPKSVGRVFLDHKEGLVIVYYILYHEAIAEDETILKLIEIKNREDQVHNPKIYLNLFVKGQESNSLRDKTSILPNYTQVNFKVSSLNFSELSKILTDLQLIPPQFESQPALKMLTKGLKKIKVKGNLNTFRKISQMYKQVAKIRDKEFSDPYIHKKLLKNKIQVVVSWKSLGVLRAEALFFKEDYMHRIASIFMKIFDNY